MTKVSAEERENARARLLDLVKPGDMIYTVLRHVSRSGMSRSISVVIHTPEGPSDMSWAVAKLLGWRFDRRNDGVKVEGCGMDMGFHLVYSLAWALFKGAFRCIGKGCPSNDHSNGMPRPLNDAACMPHFDAGYALRQRWL